MLVKNAVVLEVSPKDQHLVATRPLAGPQVFAVTQYVKCYFVAVYKIHIKLAFWLDLSNVRPEQREYQLCSDTTFVVFAATVDGGVDDLALGCNERIDFLVNRAST